MDKLWVFGGRSNLPLVSSVAWHINRRISAVDRPVNVLGRVELRDFNDGEIYVRFLENLRGTDVFIVQSTKPPDKSWGELEIMVHTAKLASAGRITVVLPYVGYARQDRKDKPRSPVAIAQKMRSLCISSGADQLVFLDAHSNVTPSGLAFLNVPVDHLWARPVMVKYLREHEAVWRSGRDLIMAAPDVHATNLAQEYMEQLGALSFAVIGKIRPRPGVSKVSFVVGDVAGKDVLIVDDMIDTGGTLLNAVDVLKRGGAENVFVAAAHGVFSGNALEEIERSPVTRMFVTDSILFSTPLPSKITVVSVAELLGEAIYRVHTNDSVSSLFETAQ